MRSKLLYRPYNGVSGGQFTLLPAPNARKACERLEPFVKCEETRQARAREKTVRRGASLQLLSRSVRTLFRVLSMPGSDCSIQSIQWNLSFGTPIKGTQKMLT